MQSPHEQCIPGPAPHDPPGCQPLGFVAELLAALDGPDPANDGRAVLRRWATLRPYIAKGLLTRREPLRAVADRLALAGVGRSTIVDNLVGRGVSKPHARRLARAAVLMRGQLVIVRAGTMPPIDTERAAHGRNPHPARDPGADGRQRA